MQIVHSNLVIRHILITSYMHLHCVKASYIRCCVKYFQKLNFFKNLLDRGNEYWGIFMYISIPQNICKRPIWVFCVKSVIAKLFNFNYMLYTSILIYMGSFKKIYNLVFFKGHLIMQVHLL